MKLSAEDIAKAKQLAKESLERHEKEVGVIDVEVGGFYNDSRCGDMYRVDKYPSHDGLAFVGTVVVGKGTGCRITYWKENFGRLISVDVERLLRERGESRG